MELPRNIRQIGIPDEKIRVYVEDYVSTYLHKLNKMELSVQKICALLGTTYEEEDKKYFFINSAFLIEEDWFDVETGNFTHETWSHIYQTIRDLFQNQELLGWALMTDEFSSVRTKLPEEQPLLFQMDERLEPEEQFFLYSARTKKALEGYFVFYERNEAMQAYIQGVGNSVRESEPEELNEVEPEKQDAAVHFRALLNARREEASQKKVMTYLYLTSSFLVMIVFVIGITMMNNYDKMKSMEASLVAINETLHEKDLALESAAAVENAMVADDAVQDTEEAVSPAEASMEPAVTEDTAMEPALADDSVTAENMTDMSETNAQAEYIVEAGDTLASICRNHYGNTEMLDTVCEVNHIVNRDKILYGQKIVLP